MSAITVAIGGLELTKSEHRSNRRACDPLVASLSCNSAPHTSAALGD